MAAGTIKTKAQLTIDIDSIIVAGGNIDAVALNGILQNVVASYEDIIRDYTTVQRDALTPVESQIIYNTTTNRLEYYNTDQWLPVSDTENLPIDCSANPNYPSGLLGDQYVVTVAGKIGGASGHDVYVGDIITCIVYNTGGTEASVGNDWKITHSASSTDSPTYYTELVLTDTQVKALHATPQTVVAAAGSGTFIMPVQIIVSMAFNSVAYATHTSMRLLMDDNNGLEIFDLSQANNWIKVTPFAFEHDVFTNQALKVTVNAGNPTAGNSPVKVKVWYKVVTI